MTLAAYSTSDLVSSVMMFIFTAGAVALGARPLWAAVKDQEQQFAMILRGGLLNDVSPRVLTVIAGCAVLLFAGIGFGITGSIFGAFLLAVLASFLPALAISRMKQQRLIRLEDQLVNGIQTLASGVRAGLNLVQSIGLVARDGPKPLRDEFAHLLREYEYGVPLEEAMDNTAQRIGSGDFRLLFSALQTHRERGGDLGETLDRIAESIREIQRLENRVKTLTAQGRANARMMGFLVLVAMAILYGIDPSGVKTLFEQNLGKVILAFIVLLNISGFLWIKKIVAIDI